MTEIAIVPGVVLRPDPDGGFDELVTKSLKSLHAEMLSDKQLWIGLEKWKGPGVRMVITVRKGKLDVFVEAD